MYQEMTQMKQLAGAALGYGQGQACAPDAPKQETLQEVQRQTLELLASARTIIANIHEAIHGPMPETANKECEPMRNGSMSVALELRNQARRICDNLDGIRQVL